eukprot:TRINITY_DN4345_c0_g1_i1.p1 TRINITY_DN4345_c0_g1~~TRINITY_DN4345_c0_g1_i1.p1  ORF type:complete len:254 (-),score=55.92 TRINITY_DN4345_c0_g1_i1:3-764(-)
MKMILSYNTKILVIIVVILNINYTMSLKEDNNNVKVLKFHSNKFVPGHPDIPQMECVGGTAKGTNYEPNQFICVKLLDTGKEWKCRAEVSPFVEYEEDDMLISCFGDPELQKPGEEHECRLEYELYFVDVDYYDAFEETTLTGSFLTILLGSVIVIFVFRRNPSHTRTVQQNQQQAQQRQQGGAANNNQNHGMGMNHYPIIGIVDMRDASSQQTTPVSPILLQRIAYGLIGVVSLSCFVFSSICAFMLTSMYS